VKGNIKKARENVLCHITVILILALGMSLLVTGGGGVGVVELL
jgi:hypothetical protein